MALTNNGTAVFILDSYLPAGYSKPVVTKVANAEYKYSDAVFSIAKSGVENATAATTFTNLVAALTVAISAMITDDFDTVGLTVSAYANLKVVTTNHNLSGVLYTNGAINYVCTVDYFVKTEAI
ncbi:MAG: hypothetical protein M0P71_12075 [Melioribacteraceae bacterium]|jgi:hypothetical protein|nr:hypothetical protein [Melioribacteraceae bacterium]